MAVARPQTFIYRIAVAVSLASAFVFLSDQRTFFRLSFDWLYLHSARDNISKEICQQALTESVFFYGPRLVDVTRAVFLVLHGLAASSQQDESINDHLAILARILKASGAALPSSDFKTLKEIVFVSPSILNDLMMAPVPPLVLKGEFKHSLNFISHLNIA